METANEAFTADTKDGKGLNDRYEICVCCRKRLTIFKSKEIEFRPYYIEGAGQLCYGCYHDLYTNK